MTRELKGFRFVGQRQDFEIVAQYEPLWSVDMREDYDRLLVSQLVAHNPGKVVRFVRRLVSDHRAKLFATIERT